MPSKNTTPAAFGKPVTVKFDAHEVTELAHDLRVILGPTAANRVIKPSATAAAQRIAAAARGNASWSSRIPSSITAIGSSKAITVKVKGNPRAPHGPYYEMGHGDRGNAAKAFTHPVFGHKVKNARKAEVGANGWVVQPVRPFVWPAAMAGMGQAIDDITAAIVDALGGA